MFRFRNKIWFLFYFGRKSKYVEDEKVYETLTSVEEDGKRTDQNRREIWKERKKYLIQCKKGLNAWGKKFPILFLKEKINWRNGINAVTH